MAIGARAGRLKHVHRSRSDREHRPSIQRDCGVRAVEPIQSVYKWVIFVLTAGALLPALFALCDFKETWIWRGSGMLFVLPIHRADHRLPYGRFRLCDGARHHYATTDGAVLNTLHQIRHCLLA